MLLYSNIGPRSFNQRAMGCRYIIRIDKMSRDILYLYFLQRDSLV